MKYKVGILWHMYGTVEVEADSIDEAIRKGNDHDGLPEVKEYIEDSALVDAVYEVRDGEEVLVAEGVTYEGTVWFPVSPVED